VDKSELAEPVVRQTTMILPHFEYEVPVLYLVDGAAYIPVRALCKMLGLRAETRIARWRKTFLWANARKLPLYMPTRGIRRVWCLHMGALPFWYSSFDWRHVAPERQVQLQQAMDEGAEVAERAHWEMLDRYKHIRCLLFALLTIYADADTVYSQFTLRLHPQLDSLSSAQLQGLVSQGKTLISEATTLARRMLHEQQRIPVVDAVEINPYGEVVETFSLPLLPVVPHEDRARFFDYLRKLADWHQVMATFLRGLMTT